MSKTLRTITEVATRHGLTHRALRFYEAQEIIAPERVGTKRLYSDREETILRLVARGKALGFSLEDIRSGLRSEPTGHTVLALPRRRLAELRHDLDCERRVLEERLRGIDAALAASGDDTVTLAPEPPINSTEAATP